MLRQACPAILLLLLFLLLPLLIPDQGSRSVRKLSGSSSHSPPRQGQESSSLAAQFLPPHTLLSDPPLPLRIKESASVAMNISIYKLPQAGKQIHAKSQRGESLDFLLFMPVQQASLPLPLLVFLHGAGESGHDASKLVLQGPPKLVQDAQSVNFTLVDEKAARKSSEFLRNNFIVLSPQCSQSWGGGFGNPSIASTILDLIDDIIATNQGRIDPARIFLTGLSMGGSGTWALAAASAKRKSPKFAAIAPVCGWVDGGKRNMDEVALAIKHEKMGVWIWHAVNDETIPVEASDDMNRTLSDHSVHVGDVLVKYSRISNSAGSDPNWINFGMGGLHMEGHASWVDAYEKSGEELWRWFLEHRRAAVEV
eukprot:756539-Hanusia_phi.AAC.1